MMECAHAVGSARRLIRIAAPFSEKSMITRMMNIAPVVPSASRSAPGTSKKGFLSKGGHMKRTIGYVLVTVPISLLFAAHVSAHGWATALGIWAGALAFAALIVFGIHLIQD